MYNWTEPIPLPWRDEGHARWLRRSGFAPRGGHSSPRPASDQGSTAKGAPAVGPGAETRRTARRKQSLSSGWCLRPAVDAREGSHIISCGGPLGRPRLPPRIRSVEVAALRQRVGRVTRLRWCAVVIEPSERPRFSSRRELVRAAPRTPESRYARTRRRPRGLGRGVVVRVCARSSRSRCLHGRSVIPTTSFRS